MKFYLKILVLFGIFMAGAVNLPRITEWLRKRDIETTAKEHIQARLKDPASVTWNAKSVNRGPKTTLVTYDFTGTKKEGGGGAVREVWTFEFDNTTKNILSVTESARRLTFPTLLPDKKD